MYELIKRCALGLATTGMILGGGLSAQAQVVEDDLYVIEEPQVVEEPDDDDAEEEVVVLDQTGMARCAATFRSFDSASGTYLTFEGETRPCPYLE